MARLSISIHASLAGGDPARPAAVCPACISIHASLAGGDQIAVDQIAEQGRFQSTPPSREATGCFEKQGGQKHISIHASLAGGDRPSEPCAGRALYFNPRLPRGRRPTVIVGTSSRPNFNPRLPRGRRQSDLQGLYDRIIFQSTPPSREATSRHLGFARVGRRFQSTPPSREATCRAIRRSMWMTYFNPRLPRGRRPSGYNMRATVTLFQSTPPSREATPNGDGSLRPLQISIHASLAGGDRSPGARDGRQRGFQSTPPSREATPANNDRADRRDISIHASLAGGDRPERRRAGHGHHFNPRLPRGRRRDGVENAAPD